MNIFFKNPHFGINQEFATIAAVVKIATFIQKFGSRPAKNLEQQIVPEKSWGKTWGTH